MQWGSALSECGGVRPSQRHFVESIDRGIPHKLFSVDILIEIGGIDHGEQRVTVWVDSERTNTL